MEVEQKISNFITKGLEKFASFQDEEHLTKTNPRKESLSTSQGSSPKASHYNHLPQRTTPTYQLAHQVHEPYEAEQIYPVLAGYYSQEKSASMDDQIHGNQEQFSKKVYRRSSTNLDEYYGKTQAKKEYRRSISGPAGLNHGQQEWTTSPQPHEDMIFRGSASSFHNYGEKEMMNSPKRGGGMEFHRPDLGVYNYSPNEWINSPKRRETMEQMQNLESNRAAELTMGQQYYDRRGWGGSHQKKEVMEIRLTSLGVQNYAQKDYIGSPKMRQNGDGSPRIPAVKEEDTNKWYGRSGSTPSNEYYHQKGLLIARSHGGHGEVALPGKNQESRAGNFTGSVGYERHGSTNVYGHQLKAPYMDAIEAAKLHGGVVIFDYSKN